MMPATADPPTRGLIEPSGSDRWAETLGAVRTQIELWSYISLGVVLIILSVLSLPFCGPKRRPIDRRPIDQRPID